MLHVSCNWFNTVLQVKNRLEGETVTPCNCCPAPRDSIVPLILTSEFKIWSMVSTECMSHLNLANLKTLSVEPSIRLVELSLIHQVWFGTTYLSFNLLYRWVGYRWFMNHTWMDPHSAGRKLNLFILLRRKLFPGDGRDLETSGSSWQDGLGPWSRIDVKSHPVFHL